METALRLSNISKKKRMELAKQVDENKIDDLRRQISESELNFETVLEAAIEKVSCLTEIEMETGILVLLHTFLFDDLKYKMEICLCIPSGFYQYKWNSKIYGHQINLYCLSQTLNSIVNLSQSLHITVQ